jgi:hypothetical protein
MIVTCAEAEPSTQSSADTGGKSERWVGPGVGIGLITEQPGWGFPDTRSGRVAVGGTGEGVKPTFPPHAAMKRTRTKTGMKERFNIFSPSQTSPHFTSEISFPRRSDYTKMIRKHSATTTNSRRKRMNVLQKG